MGGLQKGITRQHSGVVNILDGVDVHADRLEEEKSIILDGNCPVKCGATTKAECDAKDCGKWVDRRRLQSLNETTDLGFLWYKIVALFVGLQCALIILVTACYALWTYRSRISCGSKKMKRRDSAW